MHLPRPRRYSSGARMYDVVSGEWPVYRAGRVLGVERAQLRPGARVLDVGCGTGLSLPLLRAAVAAQGTVVGVDASEAMLARARVRIARAGWSNVAVHPGDAANLASLPHAAAPFDAVLFGYSLSIIGAWQAAFDQAVQLLRPDGRLVVVDMSYPAGKWRALSPLVALAFATGGVDARRKPWRLVEQRLSDVTHERLRGGHVHVVSGART